MDHFSYDDNGLTEHRVVYTAIPSPLPPPTTSPPVTYSSTTDEGRSTCRHNEWQHSLNLYLYDFGPVLLGGVICLSLLVLTVHDMRR